MLKILSLSADMTAASACSRCLWVGLSSDTGTDVVMSNSSPVKKVKMWWCNGCCVGAAVLGTNRMSTSSMLSLQQPISLMSFFPEPVQWQSDEFRQAYGPCTIKRYHYIHVSAHLSVACSRTPQWRYRDRYRCEVCSSIERLRSLMYKNMRRYGTWHLSTSRSTPEVSSQYEGESPIHSWS